MAVNVVLPDGDKKSCSLGIGTRIYDAESGVEIKDIHKASIIIEPDGLIMVSLLIPLSSASEFFGNPKK